MESDAQGAPVAKPEELWQGAFDELLRQSNCGQHINATGSAAMDCLKALSPNALLDAQNNVQAENQYFTTVAWPFTPAVDGDLIKDYPHKLVQQGKTVKVPFIAGNNKDE